MAAAPGCTTNRLLACTALLALLSVGIFFWEYTEMKIWVRRSPIPCIPAAEPASQFGTALEDIPWANGAGVRLEERMATPAICAVNERNTCECHGRIFFGRINSGLGERATVEELRLAGYSERDFDGAALCTMGPLGLDDPAVGFEKQCYCSNNTFAAGAPSRGPFAQDAGVLARWASGTSSLQKISELERIRRWLERDHNTPKRSDMLDRLMRPEEWEPCAGEAQVCICPTRAIRFGLEEKGLWVYRNNVTTDSILCMATHFGHDPAPTDLKTCQCLATWKAVRCKDGALVNWDACPEGSQRGEHADRSGSTQVLSGEAFCRAGCDRGGGSLAPRTATPRPREQLCGDWAPHELLWSCARARRSASRVPQLNHAHAAAQELLDKATFEFCSANDERLAAQLDVYLDCDFRENYLRWTTEGSEWLDEGYVTYLGGKQNSVFEWQVMNLIRSVHLFSDRPLVVVLFGNYVPPLTWRRFQNLLVYRMHPVPTGVSFNFNKIRAMIAARTLTGIELDTDQIIFTGMDIVFNATIRESHERYPFPVMPVHWMSRDAVEPQPYWEYAFHAYDGPQSMRWTHAHPTWTYWALAFLADLLHERLAAEHKPRFLSLSDPGAIQVWNMTEAMQHGLAKVLKDGRKEARKARFQTWMREDEDMLNVAFWRAGLHKAWCKFDNYPQLFFQGLNLPKDLYSDAKWYPDGIPLIFYSSHATKDFEATDWLVTVLAHCHGPEAQAERRSRCAPAERALRAAAVCQFVSAQEQWARLRHPDICCCVVPRAERPFFWQGQWYSREQSVPQASVNGHHRQCVMP